MAETDGICYVLILSCVRVYFTVAYILLHSEEQIMTDEDPSLPPA